ncbi:MAG: hypothetical protein Q8934_10860 [Bacillota bacterium]|nr:hypothetical protein [Bacillota bacterium]
MIYLLEHDYKVKNMEVPIYKIGFAEKTENRVYNLKYQIGDLKIVKEIPTKLPTLVEKAFHNNYMECNFFQMCDSSEFFQLPSVEVLKIKGGNFPSHINYILNNEEKFKVGMNLKQVIRKDKKFRELMAKDIEGSRLITTNDALVMAYSLDVFLSDPIIRELLKGTLKFKLKPYNLYDKDKFMSNLKDYILKKGLRHEW